MSRRAGSGWQGGYLGGAGGAGGGFTTPPVEPPLAGAVVARAMAYADFVGSSEPKVLKPRRKAKR